jgi:hypothetical protein
VLGSVDYHTDSVMRVLLRVVLKSWMEWVRLATFAPAGYQQMQVDLAALHVALPYLITSAAPPSPAAAAAASGAGGGTTYDPYASAGTLEELLNEAAVSASERCAAPAPMEPAILYAIAAGKLAKMDVLRNA